MLYSLLFGSRIILVGNFVAVLERVDFLRASSGYKRLIRSIKDLIEYLSSNLRVKYLCE